MTKKEVKSEATCDYEAVVKSLTEQVENLQKENDYIKKQYLAFVVDYNRQLKMAGRWFDELERLKTATRNAQKTKKESE